MVEDKKKQKNEELQDEQLDEVSGGMGPAVFINDTIKQ